MKFDPYDPKLHEDPYPVYQELRDSHPAYYNPDMDFWALSRYDDVDNALKNPDLFISSEGVTVGIDKGGDLQKAVPLLIMMDGVDHTRLRSLVSGSFAPRRLKSLESAIDSIARSLAKELEAEAEPDLVYHFSNPLPTIVIAELLGVPSEDREQFKEWSNAITQFDPTKPQGAHPGGESGPAVELAAYLSAVIEDRRKNPANDLLSQLVTTEIDGRSLTGPELLGFGFLLLVAGHETATNLISNAAILLDQHPDQRKKLIEDPSLLPLAVEEFLRFDSPVQGLARTTTEDVSLHGEVIPKGSSVLLLFASANRDERHFSNPAEFDITRSPNAHLAFGFGKHFCLGSGLARMEGRIAFEVLLERFPKYSLKNPEVERVRSGPIRGAVSLPVDLGDIRG